MQEIKFQVTIDEANLILEALGNLPFARVYGLIGKIQEQAGQQLNNNGHVTHVESNTSELTLTQDDK